MRHGMTLSHEVVLNNQSYTTNSRDANPNMAAKTPPVIFNKISKNASTLLSALNNIAPNLPLQKDK